MERAESSGFAPPKIRWLMNLLLHSGQTNRNLSTYGMTGLTNFTPNPRILLSN
jgi:hypothetical protein